MTVLIAFVSREDQLRAIDVLVDAEETYHRVPKNCFLVSDRAAELLTAAEIDFHVVSRPAGAD